MLTVPLACLRTDPVRRESPHCVAKSGEVFRKVKIHGRGLFSQRSKRGAHGGANVGLSLAEGRQAFKVAQSVSCSSDIGR